LKSFPPSLPSRIKQTISCPSLWERLQTVGSKMEHTENASSSPLPIRIPTGGREIINTNDEDERKEKNMP
jgi:hypothetical protein